MNKIVITNDPDHGTVKNLKPAFEALREYNIRITTAVFCTIEDSNCSLGKHCYKGETQALDNPEYRDFMLQLRDQGHEIAYHGYSQLSNNREQFELGLEIYKNVFGEYPYTYIEHGGHPENHPPDACKKERLDWLGSNPDSEYYVKDIVKNKVSCSWAHFNLLDGPEKWRGSEENLRPKQLEDLLYSEDGNDFFRRWRLFYLDKLAPQVSETDDSVFIGYTHFGYKGYIPMGPRFRLETWSTPHLAYRAAKAVRVNMDLGNMQCLTIKELIKSR